MRKNCKLSNEEITKLLLLARKYIPWVQANLIENEWEDPAYVSQWQTEMKTQGVWVSEPVPMFPFPGSPEYVQTFGAPPDENAWERAHSHYLGRFLGRGFSDIQESHPKTLGELECAS